MAGVTATLGGAVALIAPRNFRFVAGQRPSEDTDVGQRERLPRAVAVRILDRDDLELGRCRHSELDTNEALGQEEAVGVSPGLHRRHIGGGVVRAVDGPEERLETAGAFEARLDVRRAETHRILDLVTRHARATVGAEGLEESIGRVEKCSITRRVGRVRSIRVREDLSVRDRCLRRRDELRGTVEAQVNGRPAGRSVALVHMEGEAVGGDDGAGDREWIARAVIIVPFVIVVVRIAMCEPRLPALHEVVRARAVAAIHACGWRAAIETERELRLAIARGARRHGERGGDGKAQRARWELDVPVRAAHRLVVPDRVQIDSVARSIDTLRRRARLAGLIRRGCNAAGSRREPRDDHHDRQRRDLSE